MSALVSQQQLHSVISLCVYGCLVSQGLAGPRLWLWHAVGQRSWHSHARRPTSTVWCRRYSPHFSATHTQTYTHEPCHPSMGWGGMSLTSHPSRTSSVLSVPLCCFHSISHYHLRCLLFSPALCSVHLLHLFSLFVRSCM